MASAASSAWSVSQQCWDAADQRERVQQRDRAIGPAENVGVHRDVEAGAWTAQPRPPLDDARERAGERLGFVAVADVERHVVHLHGEGHANQRTVRCVDPVRRVRIEHVGVPGEAGVRQQARGVLARRAARAEPALRMAAGGAGQHLDATGDVGAFGILGQVGRQRALAPAMRRHRMPPRGDGGRQIRVTVGHDAAGVEHGADPLAIQQVEQSRRADLGAIFRPGQRLQIGDARLQRIAHRADAGRAALGPAFQHHIDGDGQRTAGGPTGRCGGVMASTIGTYRRWA